MRAFDVWGLMFEVLDREGLLFPDDPYVKEWGPQRATEKSRAPNEDKIADDVERCKKTLSYVGLWVALTRMWTASCQSPNRFRLRLENVNRTRQDEIPPGLGNDTVSAGMPHRCPIYAPYMLHIFKDMGHLWSMYGTTPAHPYLKIPLSDVLHYYRGKKE